MDKTEQLFLARDDATPWKLIFAAWLVASISTLGALFLGEVMGLPICVLCWYQRICMFPILMILPFGLFPFDRNVVRYALPLAGAGLLLAVFHLLLLAGVIPETIRPCAQGIPCSEKVIEWYGFVTIPLLSVFSFSIILSLLIAAYYRSSK